MELALAANNAMGNVVTIADDDRRSGFTASSFWGKGKVVDIHLRIGGSRAGLK
jgi:hypothetical protein